MGGRRHKAKDDICMALCLLNIDDVELKQIPEDKEDVEPAPDVLERNGRREYVDKSSRRPR